MDYSTYSNLFQPVADTETYQRASDDEKLVAIENFGLGLQEQDPESNKDILGLTGQNKFSLRVNGLYKDYLAKNQSPAGTATTTPPTVEMFAEKLDKGDLADTDWGKGYEKAKGDYTSDVLNAVGQYDLERVEGGFVMSRPEKSVFAERRLNKILETQDGGQFELGTRKVEDLSPEEKAQVVFNVPSAITQMMADLDTEGDEGVQRLLNSPLMETGKDGSVSFAKDVSAADQKQMFRLSSNYLKGKLQDSLEGSKDGDPLSDYQSALVEQIARYDNRLGAMAQREIAATENVAQSQERRMGKKFLVQDKRLRAFPGNALGTIASLIPEITPGTIETAYWRGMLSWDLTKDSIKFRETNESIRHLKSLQKYDAENGFESEAMNKRLKELETERNMYSASMFVSKQRIANVGESEGAKAFKEKAAAGKLSTVTPAEFSRAMFDGFIESSYSQAPLLLAGGPIAMAAFAINPFLGAAASGLMAGVGENYVGYMESLQTALDEQGYDSGSQADYMRGMSDPNVVIRANDISIKRSTTIGGLNALFMSMFKPLMGVTEGTMVRGGLVKSAATAAAAKHLVLPGLGLAYEASTEFIGEGAAQAVADTKLDIGSMILEMAGNPTDVITEGVFAEETPMIDDYLKEFKDNPSIGFDPFKAKRVKEGISKLREATTASELKKYLGEAGIVSTMGSTVETAVNAAVNEDGTIDYSKVKPLEELMKGAVSSGESFGTDFSEEPVEGTNFVDVTVAKNGKSGKARIHKDFAGAMRSALGRLQSAAFGISLVSEDDDTFTFRTVDENDGKMKDVQVNKNSHNNEYYELLKQATKEKQEADRPKIASSWRDVKAYNKLYAQLLGHARNQTDRSVDKSLTEVEVSTFMEMLFAMDQNIADRLTIQTNLPFLVDDIAASRIAKGIGSDLRKSMKGPSGQTIDLTKKGGSYDPNENKITFYGNTSLVGLIEEFDHQTLGLFGETMLSDNEQAMLLKHLESQKKSALKRVAEDKARKAKSGDREIPGWMRGILETSGGKLHDEDGYTHLAQELFANLMLKYRSGAAKGKPLPSALKAILDKITVFQSEIARATVDTIFTDLSPEELDFYRNFFSVPPEMYNSFFSAQRVRQRVFEETNAAPDEVNDIEANVMNGKPFEMPKRMVRAPYIFDAVDMAAWIGDDGTNGSEAASEIEVGAETDAEAVAPMRATVVAAEYVQDDDIEVEYQEFEPDPRSKNEKVTNEDLVDIVQAYREDSFVKRGEKRSVPYSLVILNRIGQGLSTEDAKTVIRETVKARNAFRKSEDGDQYKQDLALLIKKYEGKLPQEAPPLNVDDIVLLGESVRVPVDGESLADAELRDVSTTALALGGTWVLDTRSGDFYEFNGRDYTNQRTGQTVMSSQVQAQLMTGVFTAVKGAKGMQRIQERMGLFTVPKPAFTIKGNEATKRGFLKIARTGQPVAIGARDLAVKFETGESYSVNPDGTVTKMRQTDMRVWKDSPSEIYPDREALELATQFGELYVVSRKNYRFSKRLLGQISNKFFSIPGYDGRVPESELFHQIIDPDLGIVRLYLTPRQQEEVRQIENQIDAIREPEESKESESGRTSTSMQALPKGEAGKRARAIDRWLKRQGFLNPDGSPGNTAVDWAMVLTPTSPVEGELQDLEEFAEFYKGFVELPIIGQYYNTMEGVRLPTEAISSLKEGEEVQLRGSNIARIVKMMGTKLYSNNPSLTTAKELFQNAVDAVMKRSREGGMIALLRGSHGEANNIVMYDEGTGMTPEVILDKFLPAFVSGKEVGAGGGFGLAKLAFLGGSTAFELHTVAQVGESKYVVTKLKGTGAGYLDFVDQPARVKFVPETIMELGGDLKMTYYYVSGKEMEESPLQTGTVFNTSLKDTYDGQSFLEQAGKYIPEIDTYVKYSSTVNPARHEDEFFQDMYEKRNLLDVLTYGDREYVRSSGKVPNDPMQLLEKISVEGAELDFLVGNQGKMKESRWIEIPVLNRGILQFKLSLNFQETIALPESLAINIKPTVAADESSYPFTTNREDVGEIAKKAIQGYVFEIGQKEQKKRVDKFSNALEEAPVIEGTELQFVDTTMSVPEDLVEGLTKNKDVSEVTEIIAGVQNALLKSLEKYATRLSRLKAKTDAVEGQIPPAPVPLEKIGYGRGKFSGLFSGGQAYGVHFGKGEGETKIYHDPFLSMALAQKENPSADTDELWDRFMENIAGTSYHEALHQVIRNEGEPLARELTFRFGNVVQDAVVALTEDDLSTERKASIIKTLLDYNEKLGQYQNQEASTSFTTAQGGNYGYYFGAGSEGRGEETLSGGRERVRNGEGNGSRSLSNTLENVRRVKEPSLIPAPPKVEVPAELSKFTENFKDLFDKANLEVEERDSVEMAAVIADVEGNPILLLNPRFNERVIEWSKITLRDPIEWANYIQDEEMFHAAQTLAMKARWDASDKTEDFHTFEANEAIKIFNSIIEEMNKLNDKEALIVQNGLLASANVYYGQDGQTNRFDNWAEFESWYKDDESGQNVTSFLFEMARQLNQLKRENRITETGFKALIKELAEFVKEALASLRKLFGNKKLLGREYRDFERDTVARLHSNRAMVSAQTQLRKANADFLKRSVRASRGPKLFFSTPEGVKAPRKRQPGYSNKMMGESGKLSRKTTELMRKNKYTQVPVKVVDKAVRDRMATQGGAMPALQDFMKLTQLGGRALMDEMKIPAEYDSGAEAARLLYGLKISQAFEKTMKDFENGTLTELPLGLTSQQMWRINEALLYQVETLNRSAGQLGPINKFAYTWSSRSVVRMLKLRVANMDDQFYALLTNIRSMAARSGSEQPPSDASLDRLMADFKVNPIFKDVVRQYWNSTSVSTNFIDKAYEALEKAGLVGKIAPEREANIVALASKINEMGNDSAEAMMLGPLLSMALHRELGYPVLDIVFGNAINTMLAAYSTVVNNVVGGGVTSIINYMVSSFTLYAELRGAKDENGNRLDYEGLFTDVLGAAASGVGRSLFNKQAHEMAANEVSYIMGGGKGMTTERLEKATGWVRPLTGMILPEPGSRDTFVNSGARFIITLLAESGVRLVSAPDAWVKIISQEAFLGRQLYLDGAREWMMTGGKSDKAQFIADYVDKQMGVKDFDTYKSEAETFIENNWELFYDNSIRVNRESPRMKNNLAEILASRTLLKERDERMEGLMDKSGSFGYENAYAGELGTVAKVVEGMLNSAVNLTVEGKPALKRLDEKVGTRSFNVFGNEVRVRVGTTSPLMLFQPFIATSLRIADEMVNWVLPFALGRFALMRVFNAPAEKQLNLVNKIFLSAGVTALACLKLDSDPGDDEDDDWGFTGSQGLTYADRYTKKGVVRPFSFWKRSKSGEIVSVSYKEVPQAMGIFGTLSSFREGMEGSFPWETANKKADAFHVAMIFGTSYMLNAFALAEEAAPVDGLIDLVTALDVRQGGTVKDIEGKIITGMRNMFIPLNRIQGEGMQTFRRMTGKDYDSAPSKDSWTARFINETLWVPIVSAATKGESDKDFGKRSNLSGETRAARPWAMLPMVEKQKMNEGMEFMLREGVRIPNSPGRQSFYQIVEGKDLQRYMLANAENARSGVFAQAHLSEAEAIATPLYMQWIGEYAKNTGRRKELEEFASGKSQAFFKESKSRPVYSSKSLIEKDLTAITRTARMIAYLEVYAKYYGKTEDVKALALGLANKEKAKGPKLATFEEFIDEETDKAMSQP